MLHLIKNRDKEKGSARGVTGADLSSHLLVKFLKRLGTIGRPHILDLGPLSGANIEFFAGLGCKVQVEDLLSVAEVAPRPTDPSPGPPAPKVATPSASTLPATPAVSAPSPARPGGRPSRRIVLPPRTFPAREVSRDRSRVVSRYMGTLTGRTSAQKNWRARLPIAFNFAQETFDAIIAWDVFNYYDPESVRIVAAEVRRVLKPGGLVLSYFDTRRSNEPAAPWRYNIVGEKQISCVSMPGRLMLRQVYQNRDIEKMFAGLRIVDLYFLKNSMREILLEKKDTTQLAPKPPPQPKTPKPRFTIE